MMNSNQQMNTMTGQSDRQDAMGDDPEYDGRVTLDKSVPEISDAFADCKPGDMYKVVSDDDSELVLQKQPDAMGEGGDDDQGSEGNDAVADDTGDDSMPKSDNPAIALIMAKKMKR